MDRCSQPGQSCGSGVSCSPTFLTHRGFTKMTDNSPQRPDSNVDSLIQNGSPAEDNGITRFLQDLNSGRTADAVNSSGSSSARPADAGANSSGSDRAHKGSGGGGGGGGPADGPSRVPAEGTVPGPAQGTDRIKFPDGSGSDRM